MFLVGQFPASPLMTLAAVLAKPDAVVVEPTEVKPIAVQRAPGDVLN